MYPLRSVGKILLFLSAFFLFNTAYSMLPKNFMGRLQSDEGKVTINSNGFNAHKPSGFVIGEVKEGVQRGLTIIHFISSSEYEFKTFDTYQSEEAAAQFVEILKLMQSNKAKYAILAHDSASNSLVKVKESLKTLGFLQLSTIKGRQAYVMDNLRGAINEKIDDVSISSSMTLPMNITDKTVYFPKIKYPFEPSNDRYIAHAGGEVDGIASTNTVEALDQNYAKGFRLFEMDINETKDGRYVAAHDWKMWSRFTDYEGELPVSLAEFKKHKIYGKYTTLDLDGINKWFAAHPDAILVTDKVNDPIRFANSFVDKDRLIMELFSLMSVEEAAKNNINAMISQGPLATIKGDKLAYLAVNKVKYVALSRRIINAETDLLLALKKQGIRVYVYNVNFDPGKDEKYVQENEIGLVYGMYADKWAFDQ
tara:strand:+ start:20486 stop:21754 length:1269 start_codon:yes stop_codon:yes gene_type:complete